jgi:hypothetical protein
VITYINEKNAKKYDVLFSKATDELSKLGILKEDPNLPFIPYNGNGYVLREMFEKNPSDFYLKVGAGNAETDFEACAPTAEYDFNAKYYVKNYPNVTTLEKYFSVLGDLLKIGSGDKDSEDREVVRSQGRRFTMLPLDEDVFEVNANSREISVPEVFRKNGVAVQGDDLAEVIYFKIDRFFDATDLDTCDIYIQWEAPTGEIGVSLPWVIDIESDPNKMIIGWALSKRITSTSGNLKFALRFFKQVKNPETEENEVIFSYGTLTSSAPIKSTLNVDMNKVGTATLFKEFATDTNIVNRIANSQTKVTNVTPVNDPVWSIPTVKQETYFDLDPDMEWSGEDKGAVVLRAQAHSTDSGIITYGWRKIEKDGSITYPTSDIEYVDQQATGLTADKVRQEGIVLYELKATDPASFEPYANMDALTDDIVKTLFTKESVCKIGTVGTYMAAATNRKGFSTKTILSENYIIPEPVQFVINSRYENAIVLTDDTELAVSVTQKDKAQPNAAEGTGDAVLSYQWKRNGEIIEGADASTLKPEAAGWYQAIVTNTRNEAIVTTADKPENARPIDKYMDPLYIAYVAPAATAPQLAYPIKGTDADNNVINHFNAKAPGSTEDNAVQVYANTLDQASVLDLLRVDVDYTNWGVNEFVCGECGAAAEDGTKGSITYQWYQVKDDVDGANYKDDFVIENATSAKFDPSSYSTLTKKSGMFYCKITNTLINGTSAATYSPLFIIVDNN